MNVCIIGAGPVGLLSALYAHQNFASPRICLFERRSRSEMLGSHGRSINLALSERGLRALAGIEGLREAILKGAVPMRGRCIHDSDSSQLKIPYGRDVIYSVERDWIEEILLKRAEEVGCEVEFSRAAVDFSEDSIVFADSSPVKADLLLACDGAFSKLRTALLKRHPGRLVQEHFTHQYRELNIPAMASGQYALDPNWLHIWPRDDFMLIALPNQDGSFTATLFYDRFEQLEEDCSALLHFFTSNFPSFMAALPPSLATNSLLSDFKINPRGQLFTVAVDPLCFDGKCVLMGDAGHAILPFYGQGMNAGFEDVRLLFEELSVAIGANTSNISIGNLSSALTQYSRKRIPNAQAIDHLARLNYKEMRYQVRRRLFRAKCRLFLALERLLPGIFQSRYTMIAFTSMPYAKILVKERVQLCLLCALFANLLRLASCQGGHRFSLIATPCLSLAWSPYLLN